MLRCIHTCMQPYKESIYVADLWQTCAFATPVAQVPARYADSKQDDAV
jgi:hypothetical protein